MTHSSRTNPLIGKTAVVTLAGLSVIGTLAGCSADPGSSGSAGGSDPGPVSHAKYKDGTYTAPGSYVSPGGEEHISVTLSLAGNIIKSMQVITVRADPTAMGYEQLFESGIAAATVGKNINTLNIGVVSGSSLTSMGFNRALAKIKADAKE